MNRKLIRVMAVLFGVCLIYSSLPAFLSAEGEETGIEAEENENGEDSEVKTQAEIEKMFGENAEKARALNQEGYSWGKIQQSVKLAESSSLSMEEIIRLGDENKWGEVRKAVRMETNSGISAGELLELRKEYSWGKIKKADKISAETGTPINEVLSVDRNADGSDIKGQGGAAEAGQSEKAVEKMEKKTEKVMERADKQAEKNEQQQQKKQNKQENKQIRDKKGKN